MPWFAYFISWCCTINRFWTLFCLNNYEVVCVREHSTIRMCRPSTLTSSIASDWHTSAAASGVGCVDKCIQDGAYNRIGYNFLTQGWRAGSHAPAMWAVALRENTGSQSIDVEVAPRELARAGVLSPSHVCGDLPVEFQSYSPATKKIL